MFRKNLFFRLRRVLKYIRTLSLICLAAFMTICVFHYDKTLAGLNFLETVAADKLNRIFLIKGISISKVDIEGCKRISEDKIKEIVISSGIKSSLPFLDIKALGESIISKQQWVKSVSVKRKYPDVLFVKLSEYEPLCCFEYPNGQSKLVDEGGHVIKNNDCPRDVMKVYTRECIGADLSFISTLISTSKSFFGGLESMERIECRRWNLVFRNSFTVKLPASKPLAAWFKFVEEQKQTVMESRNEKVVDLRFVKKEGIVSVDRN